MSAVSIIIRRCLFGVNRRLGRFKKTVWVVGDPRSGTTWLLNLLDYQGRHRRMFEPFHPRVFSRITIEEPWLYLRPDEEDASFTAFVRDVFSGALCHASTDRARPKSLLFDGLLVKDVYAHLFLRYVHLRYPKIPKIWLIRHPCAVALSRERLKSWGWMEDPARFLNQERLVNDYLKPFRGLLKEAGTFFERQVVIWCVVHHVAFRQLHGDEVLRVFYENLSEAPMEDFEREIRRVFSHVGGSVPEGKLPSGLLDRYRQPSSTARSGSAPRDAGDMAGGWRKRVTDVQFKRAGYFLDAFGLGGLYGDDGRPCPEIGDKLSRHP